MTDLMEKRIDATYRIRTEVKSEWGKQYWDNVLMHLLRQAGRLT